MALPNYLGTINTYDLTAGVKLDVEDMIWLISPFDTPLQGTQGSDGRTALSADTCFEKKIEWLDEVLLTPRSTLQTGATTTDTYIRVATGTAINFMVGDVVMVAASTLATTNEYMYITGYGTTTTDTLLVTRAFATSGSAYAATTSFSLASGAQVVGVGQALSEGSDAGTARAVDRVDRFNLTQIFGPDPVQVSGTENAVQKYGLRGTEFDHQVANRVKEQFVAIDQALLYGTLSDSGSSTNVGTAARTMGGFINYISTNVDALTTTLTEATLLTQLKSCFDAGGTPDRIVTGSKQKQTISAINSTNIRYSVDTNERGQVIDFYQSDFGTQMVVLDRWVRPSELFIFSRDQATIATLRPMQFEMLAKTGDSTKGQVVAEKSLYFRRQQWAAMFNALT